MIGNTIRQSTDSGVSEALGFMLIFSMVIVGIGLVTLYGYPMLIQQQTSADEQIMEKNMIVLQNDVKSVTYKTVPFKETALKISGGTLFAHGPLSDATAPRFVIWESNLGEMSPWVDDYRPGDLRYESDSAQTHISLQNGAVVMRKTVEPGSTMLAEPRWFFDDVTNTMVITLIALNTTEPLSRTGIGNVQLKMNDTPLIVVPPLPAPPTTVLPPDTDIYIMYDPGTSVQDYSVAWYNYFTNSLHLTQVACPIGGPNARCYRKETSASLNANLIIKKFEVKVQSL